MNYDFLRPNSINIENSPNGEKIAKIKTTLIKENQVKNRLDLCWIGFYLYFILGDWEFNIFEIGKMERT